MLLFIHHLSLVLSNLGVFVCCIFSHSFCFFSGSRLICLSDQSVICGVVHPSTAIYVLPYFQYVYVSFSLLVCFCFNFLFTSASLQLLKKYCASLNYHLCNPFLLCVCDPLSFCLVSFCYLSHLSVISAVFHPSTIIYVLSHCVSLSLSLFFSSHLLVQSVINAVVHPSTAMYIYITIFHVFVSAFMSVAHPICLSAQSVISVVH